MVKNTSLGASASDIASINLNRIVSRLQENLVNPDADTEERLRMNQYERQKVGANLEYARSLLTQAEQDALNIRTQSKKQEVQTDLVRKREILQMLAGRLRELNLLGEHNMQDESSEGEDLLGEDTPDDETDGPDEQDEQDLTPPVTASSTTPDHDPSPTDPEPYLPTDVQPTGQPQPEPSQLRNRKHQQERAELLAPSTAHTTTGSSTATTDALLTHNRTEQESLTTSLLSMAAQLKQQSRAFAASLEDEKDILKRATEGLDKNELGLEAAQRKMGFLRGYTEGKGWWGRMIMYAWIFGLMVLALVIVFVLPKLRF